MGTMTVCAGFAQQRAAVIRTTARITFVIAAFLRIKSSFTQTPKAYYFNKIASGSISRETITTISYINTQKFLKIQALMFSQIG
jgi:hypothetical protein